MISIPRLRVQSKISTACLAVAVLLFGVRRCCSSLSGCLFVSVSAGETVRQSASVSVFVFAFLSLNLSPYLLALFAWLSSAHRLDLGFLPLCLCLVLIPYLVIVSVSNSISVPDSAPVAVPDPVLFSDPVLLSVSGHSCLLRLRPS